MKTIHLMVGIQGSGKTTLAKKLSSALVAKIVSTDEVRKTFPMIDEKFIWPKVYEMCAKELINGKDVIFDATSIHLRFENDCLKMYLCIQQILK